jgi:putative transposase
VPGFAIGEHHDAEIAAAALKMGVAVRGGDVAGVIFHSDCGSEYSAGLYRQVCERLEITQSMGRVGSALDNAPAESFFSTLEFECLRKHHFATKADARRVIAAWIDRSRYAGDPPAGRWGRSGCGHHRDRRLLWRSCRAWFAPQELPAVR